MSVPWTGNDSPARGAIGASGSVTGWPSPSSPVIRLGWTMTVAIPSASLWSRNSRRMSRPGTIIEPYGIPPAWSSNGTGPFQSGLPFWSPTKMSGAGPKLFSWSV